MVGLDWGTSWLAAARMVPDPEDDNKLKPKFRNQRNCYVAVNPDEGERMLKNANMSYVRFEDEPSRVYVIGQDAMQLASMLATGGSGNKVDVQRPMAAGVMQGDVNAVRIVQAIANQVLKEPKEPGELCVFSVPADPIDHHEGMNTTHHRGMAETALHRLGWTPKAFPEAQAIIYATQPSMETYDGGRADFTGIGISCGAGMINVSVTYRGMETIGFSLADAYGAGEGCSGDYIDRQIYNAYGKQMGSMAMACRYKEQFTDFDKIIDPRYEDDAKLLQYATEVAKKASVNRNNVHWHYEVLASIRVWYSKLLDYIIDQLAAEFEERRPTIDGDLPVVLAGGTAKPNGFEKLFEERLNARALPFGIGEITKAPDCMNTVALGCLAVAISQSE